MQEPKAQSLTVSGWGRTAENSDSSTELRVVKLDLIGLKECQNKFATPMVGFPNGYTIHKTQMCTLTKDKDACQVNH